MIKQLKFIALVIVFGLLFTACEKTISLPEEYELSQIEFNENTKIHDIQSLGDSLVIICGGETYRHGFIYTSVNKGLNWNQRYSNDRLSINAIHVNRNGKFWAAGDSLKLYHSINCGRTWENYPLSNFPYDQYKNPYQAIYAWSDKEILAAGGEYYQKGITSKTETGSWPWKQTSWDNQWFDILVFNIDEVIMAGYGQVMYSDDRGETFHDTKLYGDSFVDLETNNQGEIYLLGEHGEIYRYNNQSWVRIADIHGSFNAIAFNEYHAIAGGQNGELWFGDVHAGNWNKTESFTDSHITCIRAIDNDFLIGCENGSLYRLTMK